MDKNEKIINFLINNGCRLCSERDVFPGDVINGFISCELKGKCYVLYIPNEDDK